MRTMTDVKPFSIWTPPSSQLKIVAGRLRDMEGNKVDLSGFADGTAVCMLPVTLLKKMKEDLRIYYSQVA